MPRARSVEPGRLLVGWAVGVLMTLSLVSTTGGWYEYRQLSTAPGSASPDRRATGDESACAVDRDSSINVGGFEVVPGQPDPCYLRRPRIRPWQWSESVKVEIDRLETGRVARSREVDPLQAQLLRRDFEPSRLNPS